MSDDTIAADKARDKAAMRRHYEAGATPVKALCQAYNISHRSFYDTAHAEGWKLRAPRRVDKNDLIERMLRLIESQTENLEIEMMDNPTGNEAAVLSRLATTLDKLISLQGSERRPPRKRNTKAVEDIRRKVADRLAELNGK